jgi:hypothetical protein
MNTLDNWVLYRDGKLCSLASLLAILDGQHQRFKLFFEKHISSLRTIVRHRDKHDPSQILALAAATTRAEFMNDQLLISDVLTTIFPRPETTTNLLAKGTNIACTALGNLLIVLQRDRVIVAHLNTTTAPKALPINAMRPKPFWKANTERSCRVMRIKLRFFSMW